MRPTIYEVGVALQTPSPVGLVVIFGVLLPESIIIGHALSGAGFDGHLRGCVSGAVFSGHGKDSHSRLGDERGSEGGVFRDKEGYEQA